MYENLNDSYIQCKLKCKNRINWIIIKINIFCWRING
jgi:hypothetical protein